MDTTPTTPATPAAKKTGSRKVAAAAGATDKRTEAKTRFNNALDEARAGAAALKADAGDRAIAMREQARDRSKDWVAEAKVYGEQAKGKAGDLAVEGKTKASEALSSLSRVVSDNAVTLDEKFGAQYGDYARKASQSLKDASTKLDSKSVEELGEDAREMVRKSPGLAVGIAAVAGFMLARMFSGSRN